MGRHYLGDVLAGALTGVATAATLSKVISTICIATSTEASLAHACSQGSYRLSD